MQRGFGLTKYVSRGSPEDMQNFASPEAKYCNLFFTPQTRFPLAPAELRLKPVRVFGMVRGLKSRAGILPAHWNGLRRVISPLPRQAGSAVLPFVCFVCFAVKKLCGFAALRLPLACQRSCVEQTVTPAESAHRHGRAGIPEAGEAAPAQRERRVPAGSTWRAG